MKRFRFPLQAVLDRTANEKKEAQKSLAQAMQRVLEAQARVMEWTEQCAKDTELPEHDSVAAWREYDASRTYYVQQLQHAQRAYDAAIRAFDAQREQLTEKSADHKLWERAKQRAMEQYVHEMRAQEQTELDERAQTRRNKQR
ncbi:MAG: flagellar FliJ family protein [Paenibacillaceae bacterium]|nr:flagellar FliJ family protein [Paenibacillaceae bacterium]